jgi:hypothetical protein
MLQGDRRLGLISEGIFVLVGRGSSSELDRVSCHFALQDPEGGVLHGARE